MGGIKSKHGEGIRKCSRNKYIGIGYCNVFGLNF